MDPDKGDTPPSFIPFTRLHSNANRIEFCKSLQRTINVAGARRDTGKRLNYDKMCILVYICKLRSNVLVNGRRPNPWEYTANPAYKNRATGLCILPMTSIWHERYSGCGTGFHGGAEQVLNLNILYYSIITKVDSMHDGNIPICSKNSICLALLPVRFSFPKVSPYTKRIR